MVKQIETKFGKEWMSECGCKFSKTFTFSNKDLAEKHEIKCTGFKPKAK